MSGLVVTKADTTRTDMHCSQKVYCLEGKRDTIASTVINIWMGSMENTCTGVMRSVGESPRLGVGRGWGLRGGDKGDRDGSPEKVLSQLSLEG